MGDRDTEVVTYLPASLLRADAALPERALPWCQAVDGTLVMADLSGFTALSERLGRMGDEGAERLTDTINSFFARMLGTAARYGGDTLTFAGDAILLMFDGERHAERAVVASLAMLKQVARAAAVDVGADRIKVGMSVGAHSGTFLLTAAGLAEERVHLFVLGRGAETTALAEARADRGQLAVSAATLALLGDRPQAEQLDDYWRIDEFAPAGLRPVEGRSISVSVAQIERLSAYLPPYARAAGQDGRERVLLTPEHRRVSIVFVNILGINEIIASRGPGVAVEQLQSYAAMLTRLAARHRGFVVSSDIATRGSKLMVTFGAPVAHEYAATNAARFALDLIAGLRDSRLDLRHRIGVNGGHIFAGEVGPPFRRQYTAMGDATNLAARLMSAAAPGEALASRELLDRAGPTLCARELPPIKVKGKEDSIAICVLEEERQPRGRGSGSARRGRESDRMHGRLFGRRAELETLYEVWQAARRGSGRTVLVEGEAGVGKTRLLEEALRDMSDAPMITRAACFEHLQAAPFTPWLDALQGVLGLPRGASTSERTELARAYLKVRAPDFAEVGSLLNQLLALSLPQGEVVGSLDADARRQRLFELIAHILAEAAGEQAHVVVVEDLHWIDESSLALVDHLARHLGDTHVLLLLTSRPVDAPLDLGEGTGRMVLAELSEAESLGMVCEALGVEDLPAEVKETIFAKTRGNPLFLEEVVHSLQTPGVLDGILDASSVFRAEALAKLEIPDRVQGLLMSRIDRLPPDTREVLKAGSVVGRSFGERVLSGIDDGLLRSVTLGRAFAELIAAELVVRGEEDGAAFVTFRHALVQDVAYDSLPFSRRRELHGGIARYLEATQTSPDHGLLVHHYRRAGDAANTRVHAVRASESSVAVYASQEAVDYLTLALETAEARTSRDACLRSRFEELMGDSLETLSRHDDAVVCFARARRRWASPAVRRASEDALRKLAPLDDADARDSLLCWKIAVSVERGRSAYNRALRWIERGFATLPPERPGLAARMLVARCGFLSRLGRFREALTFGDEGLELARQDGDAGLQAYALSLLGLAFSGLGLLERASDCDAEAVTLYEQAGDLRGLAMSQANLASGYMFMGDLRGALEHDELALALYARIGNLNGVASQQHNVGGVLLQLGEIDAAVEHLEEALRLREHQGVNPMVTGYALVLLSQARVWSGDVEAAERELAEGVGILESIGAQGMLLDAGVVDVELRLAQGDLERAESSCRRVLSQAQSMGAELNEAQALCMLGKVQLAQGGPEAALPGLEASVALAEKIGSEYERARALAALAEARGSCADSTDACEDDLAEAIRLFERMGARYDLERAVGLRARLGSTVR